MQVLDLFNTKYEQDLKEGAVDQLERRRIDDLTSKMDDLLARARQASNPEHRAALKREFDKVKSERDSYYQMREELGAGGQFSPLGEGEMKRLMHADAERMSREAFCKKYGNEDWVCEFWDNINGPMDEAGIGHDIVNKAEKMARATPPTPAGKVASTVKHAARWLAGKGGPGKEGPTYEGAKDIVDRGEYDREGDMAKDNLHTIRREAEELERILGDNDNLPEWVQDKIANVKGMITAVSEYMQTQYEREREETTGEEGITFAEAQKKNSEKVKEDKPRDLAAAVMLKKAHAAFPIAKNDAEALALYIADKEQRDVNRLERENEQEEEMIARIVDQLKSKEVDEGWSDAIVAQRTGRPRTPYSVYIKGRKWKDFENEDHAENVANKLRAKFKSEGKDPSVITIAPTDYDKGMDEAANPAQQAAIAIAMKKAHKKPKSVAEAETDYSKRRQRERDIDAGRPVAKQRQPKQTDYQKRRAQDRKDMELGEMDLGTLAQYGAAGLGMGAAAGALVPMARDKWKEYKFFKNRNPRPQREPVNKQDATKVDEANDQIDPIIIRALERLNPGLRGSGPGSELYSKAKEALATEYGLLQARGDSTFINYLNQLQDLYNKRHASTSTVAGQGKQHLMPKVVPEEKTRLDPKCWKGKKIGNPKTKMKGGVRVNNCVPAESVNEDHDTSGVESAIIRRIMVAHLDWLQKFGPEKVMQAAEEVAYNVGDVDEIGTSDVSAYVHEVGQILGA